jgi:hypothetical protein
VHKARVAGKIDLHRVPRAIETRAELHRGLFDNPPVFGIADNLARSIDFDKRDQRAVARDKGRRVIRRFKKYKRLDGLANSHQYGSKYIVNKSRHKPYPNLSCRRRHLKLASGNPYRLTPEKRLKPST